MFDDKKVGFLGAGMMAEAIARGLIGSGLSPDRVVAVDPDQKRRDLFRDELGVRVETDNTVVAREADIVILAVKPFVALEVVDGVSSALNPSKLLVSIAAGIKTESMQSRLQGDVPIVRVMPNTPCLIGEGASALAPGKFATPDHMQMSLEIFCSVGRAVQVTEDKLDAVTGLSGSGPAYVYMFIDSLADGGVRMGLPKQTALMLAAQTVAGAAKMVLETGCHPADLRDRVTTPGGTTIAGIASLEHDGFRSAAMEAVTAATLRCMELGKPKG